MSAGGGSKSYTNRDIRQIREEIDSLDVQIREAKRALLGGGSLSLEYPRYC